MKKFFKFLCVLLLLALVITAFFNINTDNTPDRPAIDFNQEFGWKSMYYYNQLSNENKTAYIELYSAIKNFEDVCQLVTDSDSVSDVFKAILYDNPEIFWIKNDYKYYVYGKKVFFKPNYSYSEDEVLIYTSQLNSKVNEILNQANSAVTDYDKELFFHDYLCKNIIYDVETLGSVGATTYNALINGTAVCEGYARSMQLLLDKSGIYNYLVTGEGVSEGKTEAHMWNVVKIGNENYHLDVTWDDVENTKEPSYLYFNITDEEISHDHINILPSVNNCYGVYNNYSVRNGTYAYSFYSFTQFIDSSAKLLRTGRNSIEFRFKNKYDYDAAKQALDNNEQLFEYVNSVIRKSGRKLSAESIDCYCEDDLQYIRIIFKEG